MKFTIKGVLLKQTGDVLLSKASYCRVSVLGPEVVFESSDGINYVKIKIPSGGEEDGTAIVPAMYIKWLKIAAEEAGENELNIDLFKEQLRIKPQLFLLPLFVGSIAEITPQETGSKPFKVSLSELKGCSRKIRFATGSDDSDEDYNLKSVFFECSKEDGFIQLTGADYSCMAYARAKASPEVSIGKPLHKNILYYLLPLQGDEAEVSIYEKGISITTRNENMSVNMFFQELNVKPLDYKSCLNVAPNTTLSGSNLLSVVTAVGMADRDMLISLMHDSDYIKHPPRLWATDSLGGRIERIDKTLTWDGEDIKIHLNAFLVSNALKNVEGTPVITFSNPNGALTITGEDDTFKAVLLPYITGFKN